MKGLKSLAKGLFILGQFAVGFSVIILTVIGAATVINLYGPATAIPFAIMGVGALAWFIGEIN